MANERNVYERDEKLSINRNIPITLIFTNSTTIFFRCKESLALDKPNFNIEKIAISANMSNNLTNLKYTN